jgi:hypothetical protein
VDGAVRARGRRFRAARGHALRTFGRRQFRHPKENNMNAVSAVSTPPAASDAEPEHEQELKKIGVHDTRRSSPGDSGNAVDHGGKVLTHVDVAPVYLGAYWKTAAGTKDRTHNDAALADLVKNKGITGIWKQYRAGPGTTSASTLLPNAPRRLTQEQLETLLKQQLAAGKLDASNPQRVFTFVLPPGCELVGEHGESSRHGVGGLHGSITEKGKQVYYAAVVYSQGSLFGTNGIDFTGKPQDNMSIAESHEVTEAVTDPDVELANRTHDTSKLGWYDDVTPWAHDGVLQVGKGEVGDIPVLNAELHDRGLASVWGRSDGFAFQKEWSNEDGRAELEPKKP